MSPSSVNMTTQVAVKPRLRVFSPSRNPALRRRTPSCVPSIALTPKKNPSLLPVSAVSPDSRIIGRPTVLGPLFTTALAGTEDSVTTNTLWAVARDRLTIPAAGSRTPRVSLASHSRCLQTTLTHQAFSHSSTECQARPPWIDSPALSSKLGQSVFSFA